MSSILIVEDEILVRIIWERSLNTPVAANADEAIEILESRATSRPHTRQNMPGSMDGLGWLRR
jgi:CheY-like chemotaxis protein